MQEDTLNGKLILGGLVLLRSRFPSNISIWSLGGGSIHKLEKTSQGIIFPYIVFFYNFFQ